MTDVVRRHASLVATSAVEDGLIRRGYREVSRLRGIARHRLELNLARQELATLAKLRVEFELKRKELIAAAENGADARRAHIRTSIRLIDREIEEAERHISASQRILLHLEHASDAEPRSRRRRRSVRFAPQRP